MTVESKPPNAVQRWTFATAWMDGPWLNSTERWDNPLAAAEGAAAWLVHCARANQLPRVRVQLVSEIPPVSADQPFATSSTE